MKASERVRGALHVARQVIYLVLRWVPTSWSAESASSNPLTYIQDENARKGDEHAAYRQPSEPVRCHPLHTARVETCLFSPPEIPFRSGPPTTVSAASRNPSSSIVSSTISATVSLFNDGGSRSRAAYSLRLVSSQCQVPAHIGQRFPDYLSPVNHEHKEKGSDAPVKHSTR